MIFTCIHTGRSKCSVHPPKSMKATLAVEGANPCLKNTVQIVLYFIKF